MRSGKIRFRRRSDRFGSAALLMVLMMLSQVACSPQEGRPVGDVRDLDQLSRRDDLNLVFLLVDTLRADRLGCYGHPRPTSPAIDALAQSGIRFARVESQSSWTKPSMVSLWTGIYPASHAVHGPRQKVPEEATTAVELLRQEGFRTLGIFRNSFVGKLFGFGQGFEQYVYPRAHRRPAKLQQRSIHPYELPGSDEVLVEQALGFLDAIGPQRFFLYLHFMDVHQYVFEETKSFGKTVADVYDGAVAWVDSNVGVFVEGLRERNLLSRTLIVVASDHGETLDEREPLGHGHTLFLETTDVPVILSLPFRLEPGVVVRTPVENLDLWPTLLDLLGLPPLPSAQGRSLVPLVQAAARGDEAKALAGWRGDLYAELDRSWSHRGDGPAPLVAVTDGRYRLIVAPSNPTDALLFDLDEDPDEQRNVAARHPEIVEKLLARVGDHERLPRIDWSHPPKISVDAPQLEELRALGYVIR